MLPFLGGNGEGVVERKRRGPMYAGIGLGICQASKYLSQHGPTAATAANLCVDGFAAVSQASRRY